MTVQAPAKLPTRPVPATWAWHWRYALCAAVVGAGASLTYLPWISNYLVADSWALIGAISNPDWSLADLLPFREVPGRVNSTYYYAPTVVTALWIAFKLGGYNPEPYHLMMIGFHVVTSLLLLAAVVEMTRSLAKGLLAGLVFAVHFANTETIGWFGSITHPLVGLFGALALLAYSRFLTTRRAAWWGVALAALVAGGLAQATGLPWFGVVVVLEVLHARRRGDTIGAVRRSGVLAALLLVMLLLQAHSLSLAPGGYRYALGPWVALNLAYYPLSAIMPSLEAPANSFVRDLMMAPADWEGLTRLLRMTDAFNMIMALALLAVASLGLWLRGGWLGRFCIVAFLLSLTPFLLINGQGYRYLYTPLMFFSTAVAVASVDSYRFLRPLSKWTGIAVLSVVPMFAVLSFAESQRQLFWWQQAGYVTHRSLNELKQLQPEVPPGTKLVFGGLPDTLHGTNAQVWRQGIGEAVWAVYGDRTIRVEAYGKEEVQRLFREELKGAPGTLGFLWEDWHLVRIAPKR